MEKVGRRRGLSGAARMLSQTDTDLGKVCSMAEAMVSKDDQAQRLNECWEEEGQQVPGYGTSHGSACL